MQNVDPHRSRDLANRELFRTKDYQKTFVVGQKVVSRILFKGEKCKMLIHIDQLDLEV